MTKLQFLLSLNKKLSGLPQDDIEERLSFYSEMIEDRMEEGMSEEEAVAAIGSVDEIVEQIIAEIPLSKIAKERIKPKRELKTWETFLLALGSPIWFSLLIAAFTVLLSFYVSVWAVIISLWSVFISVAGCSFAGIAVGVVYLFGEHALTGIAMIAAGLVLAGLAIYAFFGCKSLTKGCICLTKRIVFGIKSFFIKKEVE